MCVCELRGVFRVRVCGRVDEEARGERTSLSSFGISRSKFIIKPRHRRTLNVLYECNVVDCLPPVIKKKIKKIPDTEEIKSKLSVATTHTQRSRKQRTGGFARSIAREGRLFSAR